MVIEGIGPGVSNPQVAEQVEIQAKYAGYIQRQTQEIERLRRYTELPIPSITAYDSVIGLSTEIRQKLNEHKPETIGLAARIPGMTPAALSLLLVHLKKK
jgi:tRNA uridine 5-carboxymethylaminomethyl modification enzyme